MLACVQMSAQNDENSSGASTPKHRTPNPALHDDDETIPSYPRMASYEYYGWQSRRQPRPNHSSDLLSACNTLFRQSQNSEEKRYCTACTENSPARYHHVTETETMATLFLTLNPPLRMKDVTVHISDHSTLVIRGYSYCTDWNRIRYFLQRRKISSSIASLLRMTVSSLHISSSPTPSSSSSSYFQYEFSLDTSVLNIPSLQLSLENNTLQISFQKKDTQHDVFRFLGHFRRPRQRRTRDVVRLAITEYIPHQTHQNRIDLENDNTTRQELQVEEE